MSTLVSQPNHTPAWKQEVNRRLAEHKSRKGLSIVEPAATSAPAQVATSRAAQAAARVAARYAKAPSYSELQAAEARTAVRAAEIATEVALDAQAAASAALAGLEAACDREKQALELPRLVKPEPAPALAPPPAPAETDSVDIAATQSFEISTIESPFLDIRLETADVVSPVADLPVQVVPPQSAWQERDQSSFLQEHDRFEMDDFDIPVEDWWRPAPPGVEMIQQVEPDQPIHANLIQFPRELVAARKARPHLTEQSSVAVAEPVAQLSIFEVDPGVVSVPAGAEARLAQPSPFAWSGIRLDEELLEEPLPEPDPVRQAVAVELAPFSRRLLAAVVDGALVTGVSLAAAFVAAANMDVFPAIKILELTATAGLAFAGLIYLALFASVGAATPGMKYAGISLRTLKNRRPTCAQRFGRLGALVLSVLPVGLGIALAIFDEDHLSWHDRLSGTYQGRA